MSILYNFKKDKHKCKVTFVMRKSDDFHWLKDDLFIIIDLGVENLLF